MGRDIDVMNDIQAQKVRDIEAERLLPLDAEGRELAEGKRFTFDVINIPTDPLR